MSFQSLFLAVAFLLSGGLAQTNCRFIGDVVFVIDESGSISNSEYMTVKTLVKDVVNALDIDMAKEKVRVGIAAFGSTSATRVTLGGYANKAALLTTIMGMTQGSNGVGSNTNVQAGLIEGWNIMKSGLTGNTPGSSRPGVPDNQVPRIMFIFGDGQANTGNVQSTSGLTALANEIKQAGFDGATSGPYGPLSNPSPLPHPVSIFSVFVGSVGSSGETLFKALASSPESMWFRNFNSFGMVDGQQLATQFCDTGSSTFGDVHFTTHDGVMYTFNGAGDFIYMRTDNKIDIHVRDVYVGRATALAAMAISDKKTGSVLEIWWDGKSSEKLVLNIRNINNKRAANKAIAISRKMIIQHPFTIQQVGDGLVRIKHVEFTGFEMDITYGGRSSFLARIPENWETAGLGGNNNGLVEDELCTRIGKCASMNATNEDIHQIGLDWAVLPSELLFEKWMPVQDWEIRYHELDFNSEQLNAAKRICGDVQPCIYDYISTGSEEYAKHTKTDYHAHIFNDGKLVYVGDKF